jgi:hypothetical protein
MRTLRFGAFRRFFVGASVAALLAILTRPLVAQQSIQLAKGPISIFPSSLAGSLTIDLAETGISFQHVKEREAYVRSHTTRVAVATQKNKRSILARGEFSPSLTLERREFWGNQTKLALLNFYLGGRIEITDNSYAAYTDATETIFNLDHEVGTTVALTLGTNIFSNAAEWRNGTLGLAVEARRGWNSPGIRTAQSVCVDKATAVDGDGNPVRVTKCEDRFVGALEDLNSLHARADFVGLRFRLPAQADTARMSIGVLAGVSSDLVRGNAPAYNFGIGPALFTPKNPDILVAALLFEVNDATNSSGQLDDFSDRLAVRLYLAVPFKF